MFSRRLKLSTLLCAGGLLMTAVVAQARVGEDEKKDTAKQEYKQTPFGKVSKSKAPAPRPAVKRKSNVSVKVEGDTISFSRPTPFGAQRWTRKRAELNANEKQWLADHEKAPAKPAKESTEK